MNILKTETPNDAKSIGSDGQVVHTGSEDGRRAEEQNDLEASMAEDNENGSEKSRSSKASGDMEGLNDTAGLDPNLSRSSSIRLSNANNSNENTGNENTGNQNNSNENNGNKNDDDGPPLVAILAVFCLAMIVGPFLSSQGVFKGLPIHFTLAFGSIPIVLEFFYLPIKRRYRWCGCSLVAVGILTAICLGVTHITDPSILYIPSLMAASALALFLLTMWLLQKAHRANREGDSSSNGPVVSTTNAPNTSTIQEKYPSNTYSFLAFYDPIRETKLFCFGLFVSLFQFALLFLMAANVSIPKFRTTGEVDNPGGFNIGFKDGEWWGGGIFPSNCGAIVRATQIVSLMAYVLFPSPILNDVTESLQLFPRFGQQDPDGKLKRLRFACTLQFVQGLLSTLSVFVLVMTSTDVIEIILNFTATNFISELDDNAFQQAENGKYGPIIEEAVHSIKGEDLPNPISKRSKHKRYKYGIVFITCLIYIATAGVMVAQDNSDVWVTPTVRVQFDDDRSSYSGCYHMDTWDSSTRRYDYVGDGNNTESATMGYCLDERRWLLFQGEGNPCAAFGKEGVEIAHSSKTDFYDIQSSIAEDWFTSFNTPIDDMYFIQAENISESCGAFPGDGKCDEFLNNFDYQYDGGDCCSMTCIGDGCGSDNEASCKDPSMTPFTVRIDSDVDVPGVLKLDCISNEKNYAVTIQANWTEPFMVEKGSSCRFYFTTTEIKGDETPLDYSVHHGYGNLTGVMRNEYFNIFSTTADQQNQTLATFDIPPAMLSRQGELITSTAQKFYDFINYLDPDMDMTIANIVNITNIEAAENALTGPIPTEFGLMKNLTTLYLDENYLTGTIPTEIGLMKSLTGLGLYYNALTGTIPTEIGLMKSLTVLWLAGNDLTGTIPTEFGLMKNLTGLGLYYNTLTATIPTEFGLMKSLTFLALDQNDLTGTIPTEIGLMKSLMYLDLADNALTGTIPTEFGLMKNLTELYLYDNNLSGSTPSEVMELIDNGLYCDGCPY